MRARQHKTAAFVRLTTADMASGQALLAIIKACPAASTELNDLSLVGAMSIVRLIDEMVAMHWYQSCTTDPIHQTFFRDVTGTRQGTHVGLCQRPSLHASNSRTESFQAYWAARVGPSRARYAWSLLKTMELGLDVAAVQTKSGVLKFHVTATTAGEVSLALPVALTDLIVGELTAEQLQYARQRSFRSAQLAVDLTIIVRRLLLEELPQQVVAQDPEVKRFLGGITVTATLTNSSVLTFYANTSTACTLTLALSKELSQAIIEDLTLEERNYARARAPRSAQLLIDATLRIRRLVPGEAGQDIVAEESRVKDFCKEWAFEVRGPRGPGRAVSWPRHAPSTHWIHLIQALISEMQLTTSSAVALSTASMASTSEPASVVTSSAPGPSSPVQEPSTNPNPVGPVAPLVATTQPFNARLQALVNGLFVGQIYPYPKGRKSRPQTDAETAC
ncbi:unnamed protein product [Parajaminaea phylloscopi]